MEVKDSTWDLIEETSKDNREVNEIKLSRNKGHQTVLITKLYN